jgi:hypothetical protein
LFAGCRLAGHDGVKAGSTHPRLLSLMRHRSS